MTMTTEEFDVLDELYFVASFGQLLARTGMDELVLKSTLGRLLGKSWIECHGDDHEAIHESNIDFESSFKKYSYLATKEGLLVHTKG
jgi:hypothetical protein